MPRIERVLLIFPPSRTRLSTLSWILDHPLGISYIAAVLRKELDVKILDATAEGFYESEQVNEDTLQYGLSYEEIIRRVDEYKPDVVGISCLFSNQFPIVGELTALIKKLDKNIITITGGTHPTFLYEKCMERAPALDYIALNEADYTLRDLIRALNKGNGPDEIDGLVWRDANGDTKVNPKTKYIEDIDDLPFPARDLLPMDKYFEINYPQNIHTSYKETATIMTSRGCPAKCIFCSSAVFWNNHSYRPRRPEKVLEEMEELKGKFGIREIHFTDDNLTLKKDRAMEIFDGMIERKFNFKWATPNGTAIWALDDEMIKRMAQSGAFHLTLAFESGDQDVLTNIIKKPLNLEKCAPLVKIMKKNGISVSAFFVLGFPGETRQQIMNTYEFAKRIQVDHAWMFIASPLPGTVMYEIMAEKGMLPDDFDFENNFYFSSNHKPSEVEPEELERLARKFMSGLRLRHMLRDPIGFIRQDLKSFLFKYMKTIIKSRFKKRERKKTPAYGEPTRKIY